LYVEENLVLVPSTTLESAAIVTDPGADTVPLIEGAVRV